MMRPVLAFTLVFAACSPDDGGEDLERFLDEAETAIQGYETWDQISAWEGIQPSESVHGAFTEIWYNDVAVAAIEAAAGGDMPDGAVIVKQAYGDAEGTDLMNLTVMQKREDYGWFWASWDPDGVVLQSGQPDGCVSCHEAGQDYNLVATW